MATITVGQGLQNPQGELVELPSDVTAAEALIRTLEGLPAATEGWFSGHTWKESRRSTTRWLSASFLCVDVDYVEQGKHIALPKEYLAEVQQLIQDGLLPGNVFYDTPRGFRVVFALEEPVTNGDRFKTFAAGAGMLCRAALEIAELPNLTVDEKVLYDRARLLYTPNAIVDGSARHGALLLLRAGPYTEAELNPPPPKVVKIQTRSSNAIEEAARNYNRGSSRTYPRNGGQCPACGHKDCFGMVPESSDPVRWACFSDKHRDCGLKKETCWVGDALDLDAFEAGCSRVELLRRRGYLPQAGEPKSANPDETPEAPPLKSNDFSSLCTLLMTQELRHRVLGPGLFEFDEFRRMALFDRKPITDVTISRFRDRCSVEFKGLRFGREDIYDAMRLAADENKVHPVREYLRATTWDREERIAHVAEDILGVKRTPLHVAMLRKWFISAVARIMEPGIKVDTVLILAGPEGIGKSSFFDILGGDWHVDTAMTPGERDAYQALNEAWIYEWAELTALQRARDQESIKAFISARSDTYRAPYARAPESHPRHCVIVGTTNEEQFLGSNSGNRRFWILHLNHRIDTSRLRLWRNQLWAEAYEAYLSEEDLILPDELEKESRARAAESIIRDAWEPVIADYLVGRATVTIRELLRNAIDKPVNRMERRDEMRVASVLRGLGWSRERRMEGGERSYHWIPPAEESDSSSPPNEVH